MTEFSRRFLICTASLAVCTLYVPGAFADDQGSMKVIIGTSVPDGFVAVGSPHITGVRSSSTNFESDSNATRNYVSHPPQAKDHIVSPAASVEKIRIELGTGSFDVVPRTGQ
jgi:hypothetical protein